MAALPEVLRRWATSEAKKKAASGAAGEAAPPPGRGGGGEAEGAGPASGGAAAGAGGDGGASDRAGRGEEAGPSYQRVLGRVPGLLRGLAREVRAVLLPQEQYAEMLQSHAVERGDRPVEDEGSRRTELVAARVHVPRWRRLMDEMRAQAETNETVQAVLRGLEERRGQLQDKWETSDNPMVHRIQDMTEGLWSESEYASAMR